MRLEFSRLDAEEKLEEQQQELQKQISDALTGLANRRAFDGEIMNLERALLETRNPSCVMMIDVDHFKKFNDNFGHQAGDEVLRGVGRVLLDQLADEAMACRYGGEEFCAIFRDVPVSWTGLSDHESFRQDVSRRLSEWKRGGGSISLIILEIDAYDAMREELSKSSARWWSR
ncbi:MAG TPA: GGDEF domain-containing protein [Planctomycetaceae bacterium]|nr:GGDEF domain-containing protein [Planctomycetaceae bacterium]